MISGYCVLATAPAMPCPTFRRIWRMPAPFSPSATSKYSCCAASSISNREPVSAFITMVAASIAFFLVSAALIDRLDHADDRPLHRNRHRDHVLRDKPRAQIHVVGHARIVLRVVDQ